MKKKLTKTKCTVKLRKSEYYEEWYLMIESYPVYMDGKKKRQVEMLGRTIKTPIWNKSSPSRASVSGSKNYKPLRDLNGVIRCVEDVDTEACFYADRVRRLRQAEYDNTEFYTDVESALVEKKERESYDFIEYIANELHTRHASSSKSIIINWKRVLQFVKQFNKNEPLPFSMINLKTVEMFRRYILAAPCGGHKQGTISQNTASTYFSIFKAALKQAFVDGYLATDLAAKIKSIPVKPTRREYLSISELEVLAITECDRPEVKRAALFSALTGLRHCDIQELKWRDLQKNNNGYRINFTQKKTGGVEYMPISEQAYILCGERTTAEEHIFADLPDPSWVSVPLKRWIKSAGIDRNITFHCFRHTYATQQIANGTDIYTVSKMLGHSDVKTTQLYAKIVDEKKTKAAEAINIRGLTLEKK